MKIAVCDDSREDRGALRALPEAGGKDQGGMPEGTYRAGDGASELFSVIKEFIPNKPQPNKEGQASTISNRTGGSEMDITGIAKSRHADIQKAGKESSKKEWKLSDSLREKIAEYAREDAAQNVYMGNKFLALRKSEVAKVAPDRAALMGKVSQEMADMKTIREADRRWLCLLFGEPYEAEFQSEGTGSAVHVYDGNGDEVLTYTAGVGWHEKESKAETQVHGALKAAYYDAFRAARQEINGMEVQGGFDVRA